MSIGENIKSIRKIKKMSIRDLVEISGVGKSTISDIENDKVSPTAATLQKIANALDVSLNDFFDDANKKDNINVPENYASKYTITEKDKKQYTEEIKKANEAFFLNDELNEEAKKEMLDLMSELFWKAKALNKEKRKKSKDK